MENTPTMGKQVNGMAYHRSSSQANENRAALCNGGLRALLEEHFLSGVGWGQQAGDEGEGLGI